eukprot:s293_g24.t1
MTVIGSGFGKKKRISLTDLVPPPGLMIPDSMCESGTECGPVRAVDPIPLSGSSKSCGSSAKIVGKTFNHRERKIIFWEIFSGCGRLSKTFFDRKHRVVTPIDIEGEVPIDVSKRAVQEIILSVINGKLIEYIHFGTPCTVFSRARRSISNWRKARRREELGCCLATFTVEACFAATRKGIFWSVENPASSRLWEYPDMLLLRSLPGVQEIYLDQCQYGVEYKKPTMIWTIYPGLAVLNKTCTHFRHSVVLCGQVKVGGSWKHRTSLAGAYPPQLCEQWVSAVDKLRDYAAPKPLTDFGRVVGHMFKTSNQPQRQPTEQGSDFQVPGFLESIVFGQHSKAEAEARRQRRAKAKWFKKRKEEMLRRTWRSGGASEQTQSF